MSDSTPKRIASKWNARYAYANNPKPTPADVLINGAHFLPASGLAVDIACGLGGNAVYLAEKGLSVFAWDISSTAIESMQQKHNHNTAGQKLVAQVRDVVVHPPEQNRFDVIVVSRFLDRGLCPALSAALRPNGVLFYQTFTAGLSNPDYLLRENELPSLFPALTPCYTYESPLNSRGFSEAHYIGRKSLDEKIGRKSKE